MTLSRVTNWRRWNVFASGFCVVAFKLRVQLFVTPISDSFLWHSSWEFKEDNDFLIRGKHILKEIVLNSLEREYTITNMSCNWYSYFKSVLEKQENI